MEMDGDGWNRVHERDVLQCCQSDLPVHGLLRNEEMIAGGDEERLSLNTSFDGALRVVNVIASICVSSIHLFCVLHASVHVQNGQ